ncbi:hypothetical protein X975_02650, partial [Stegodyphus mimosarum]
MSKDSIPLYTFFFCLGERKTWLVHFENRYPGNCVGQLCFNLALPFT